MTLGRALESSTPSGPGPVLADGEGCPGTRFSLASDHPWLKGPSVCPGFRARWGAGTSQGAPVAPRGRPVTPPPSSWPYGRDPPGGRASCWPGCSRGLALWLHSQAPWPGLAHHWPSAQGVHRERDLMSLWPPRGTETGRSRKGCLPSPGRLRPTPRGGRWTRRQAKVRLRHLTQRGFLEEEARAWSPAGWGRAQKWGVT